MNARQVVVSETEWWDRIAMALDRLLLRPGARKDVHVPPGVTAHVFNGVTDVETLRRLTQMPDETPMDLLLLPFSVYCPDMETFISVNDPDTPVEEHLRRLKGE